MPAPTLVLACRRRPLLGWLGGVGLREKCGRLCACALGPYTNARTQTRTHAHDACVGQGGRTGALVAADDDGDEIFPAHRVVPSQLATSGAQRDVGTLCVADQAAPSGLNQNRGCRAKAVRRVCNQRQAVSRSVTSRNASSPTNARVRFTLRPWSGETSERVPYLRAHLSQPSGAIAPSVLTVARPPSASVCRTGQATPP
jgi:hypothetical protein